MGKPGRVARASLLALVLAVTALEAQAAAVVRGPYLQRLSSTEVTIRWRTDVPTHGRVRFGTSLTDLALYPEGTSAQTDHAVTLTGLRPETTYFYAIATPDTILAGGDTEHRFVTAPESGARRPTRFWLLGDAGHGTRAGSFAPDVRDAMTAWTAANPLAGRPGPDHLLLLGDNAYPKGTDADYQNALFDTHGTVLRRVPVWPAIGNHDLDSPGYDEEAQTGAYFDIFTLPARGESGGVASERESYYSFDVANVHVVVLNSPHPPYLAMLEKGNPMLAWLERDLAATSQEWIIAYWHYPPYGKATYDSDVNNGLRRPRENYLPMLEAAGVDLVLGGHNHYYARSYPLHGAYGPASTNAAHILDRGDGRPGGSGAYTRSIKGPGTVYLVSGGSSSVLPPEKLGHHPVMFTEQNVPGSVIVDVDGLRLDVYFIDHEGAERDSFTIVKTGAGSSPDATPPTAPPALAAVPVGSRQIDLAWTAAADGESGIALYLVYRDGMLVGTSATTSFQDRGLRPETAYVYEVAAVNGVRMAGPRSEVASATTPAESVLPLSVTLTVTAFAPADGLEMNRPSVRSTCAGGSGRYDWVIDWDAGDHIQTIVQASSPRTVKLPSTHPGLNEGPHTLRVSCAQGDGRAHGEATVPITIGAREIVAELVPVTNVRWAGDELLALEGAAHSMRLRVAEGHYSGGRYDYRIAWGDGSPDFAPARTSATTLSATHRYPPVGAVYPLVAAIEDGTRGRSHTLRADVRVVPRAVYDQPAPSIRVSLTALSFLAMSGGANPPPRTVELTNAGAGSVSWSVAVDSDWVTVTPSTGTLEAGETAVLSLAPSIEGLADGEHAASVTISAPGAAGSPQVVTATMLIDSPDAPREVIIAERASGYQPFGNASITLAAAQSFVAPSASIHGIVVALSREGSPAHAVTATIRRTLNGPDLATVQLPAVASVDYRNPSSVVGTFPAPVPVVPGETYLIVLGVPAANSGHHYRWSVDIRNPYPDGMVQIGTKAYQYHDANARIMYGQP
jgi:hypothetical protein